MEVSCARHVKLLNRWRILRHELDAQGVKLLAVSKYAVQADVALLADAGQQDFAESRPQQLRDRVERFPGVNWHMIGPLQKNKAKYIGRHAFMWHSVEDIETAGVVAAYVHGRKLPVIMPESRLVHRFPSVPCTSDHTP